MIYKYYKIVLILNCFRIVWCSPNSNAEIKALTGEPDYRSVNLTWGIEDIELIDNDKNESITDNESNEKFTVYYCELQSWGPHRCKSKNVNENEVEPEEQYSTVIKNLRMATKYLFHVRPYRKGEISGRADLGMNELGASGFQGQTIVIPTKGFSAHATKCLPHASEIEVETGPYFAGKIVAEGNRNCAIQGDATDIRNTYTMRIDHDQCGSRVDQDTLTVETDITVQENVGIFTHSTRRFVVVCTYQPDTLTVRASFSVPGKSGVADVVPDWTSDRDGRNRKFRMVDKSSLVLKEDESESINDLDELLERDQRYNRIYGNLIDDSLNEKAMREAKYARLIDDHQSVKSYRVIPADHAGLILTVSLSIIMIGALLYVLHRELKKQRFSGK